MPEQEPSRFGAMKQGFMEAVGNGIEHIQNGIDSLRQNADRLKAIGQITLLGTGFGTGIGLALPNAVGAEGPVNTSNNPAAEATASDQAQDCVDAALDEPLAMHNDMAFPGAKHKQDIEAWMRFKPTTAACAPLVSRATPTAVIKMQRPNNHSKLIKSKTKKLLATDGSGEPMDANGGQLGDVAFGKYWGDGNKLRYRCSRKGTTHMWITFNVKVDSAVDGSKLGQRSFTQAIKIPHTRPDLVRDHAVKGPC
ncbi:MAG TPA: hypothetical protein VFW77_04185 [Candidatus Saccharimonadales bacterium]|nr:hypothetical protein [Candidatus Saccharimonadales bacterium]